MTNRRCSALFILLVIYSAVYCDSSNIFNLFKRTSSSHGHGHGHGHPGARSDEAGASYNDYEQTTSYDSSSHYGDDGLDGDGIGGSGGSSVIGGSGGSGGISGSGGSGGGSSGGRGNYMNKGRGHQGWSAYGGGHGHGGDSNLDLYSLLGGLSFASLLGATIVFLSRRSGSTTVMMTNMSGRRRRRDLDDADEELVGESLPEFLSKLGDYLDNPWWKREDQENKDKVHQGTGNSHQHNHNKVVPFKLV